MAARFVDVSESEIDQLQENALPQKTRLYKIWSQAIQRQVDKICRSEPPSTDILRPQNLLKICLFFILFSRIIINVIILKQLVASGDVVTSTILQYSRHLRRLIVK